MKTQKLYSNGINYGMSLILGIILSGSLFLQSCSKEENMYPAGSPAKAVNERQAGDFIAISHDGSTGGAGINVNVPADVPVYSVKIAQFEDGSEFATVTYDGRMNVAVEGTIEWQVEVSLLDALSDFLRENRFFDLDDYYRGGNENSSIMLSLMGNEKAVQIIENPEMEAPANIIEMQKIIEAKLGIDRLVNK